MRAVKGVGEPCAGEPPARWRWRQKKTRPVGLRQPHGPGASRRPDTVLAVGGTPAFVRSDARAGFQAGGTVAFKREIESKSHMEPVLYLQ
jgi:hypothetical protein